MAFKMEFKPIGDSKPFFDVGKMERGLKNAIRDEAADGVRYMQTYPPQFPTPYVRTGTLRHSWSFVVRVTASIIAGIILSQKNIAPYNEFVQGESPVPLFDDRGWRNVNDLADKINREFPGRAQKEIDKAA